MQSGSGTSEKRFRFGSQFAAIVAATETKKKWYQVDWREKMTHRNGYIFTAIMSFVLMFLFGAMSIRVEEACLIQNPTGRCCTCVEIANPEDRLHGQSIPKQKVYNSVWYGIVMMLNSFFGIQYVIQGVQSENKYLLFCMMVTQALECIRGLVDVVLEPKSLQEAEGMRTAREVVMFVAMVFMIVSWVFMRPVYKKFGWKIFRRGGAKKSIRDMYKNFQRFRALNLLDIQSSFLIYVILLAYISIVHKGYYLLFICFVLMDILASRYMVKYLKREDKGGVIVSSAAKAWTLTWWIGVVVGYIQCFDRYQDSRERTAPWWSLPRVPNLDSVYNTYNGLGCLTEHSTHDARTYEVLLVNLAQAIIFRSGSLVFSGIVMNRFGQGLRDVFYRRSGDPKQNNLIEDGDENDESEMFGGPATVDDPMVGEFSDDDVRDSDLRWDADN